MRRRLYATVSVLAVAVVLAGTFMLYWRPALMVQLAEQLWACF
ncbi:hypothetical protein [Lampropedia cohaerens]|nr:hypothetical protein [Lampropedia cohaerens]